LKKKNLLMSESTKASKLHLYEGSTLYFWSSESKQEKIMPSPTKPLMVSNDVSNDLGWWQGASSRVLVLAPFVLTQRMPTMTPMMTFMMNHTDWSNSNRVEASDSETHGLSFAIDIKTLDCYHRPLKGL